MMSSDCIQKKNDLNIVFKEKNRKFLLLNKNRLEYLKYKIDNCLIKNLKFQKQCDYGLTILNSFYFIELKGNNLIQAFRQVNDTIDYFRNNFSKDIEKKSLFVVIIPTKNSVPKLENNPDYLKLLKKVGKRDNILIKSKELKIEI